ncbi:hypothetical protein HPB52_022537 [Rhipicephalus sanguineus]|uniref:Uncharacterized protein n=1 Tax=Rhipicephalus sanguineus TaxID=34632 RepID=A0A9D4SZ75_RHISA|nr:hypothetical protein HPB52_022537 [Rhipicephalus sanguineus]
MPPPKQHFFNVRTTMVRPPPGTSVGEVIDAVESLVTTEIYSMQHQEGLDFQVGVLAARTAVYPSTCPRVGGTLLVTMPPPKGHFFDVRTPPGTSVDEVIDAVEHWSAYKIFAAFNTAVDSTSRSE